jgi:predicted TIM-barrel fold metal-dependent hydrolase
MTIIDFHFHLHKREWERGTSFLVFNYGGKDYTELTALRTVTSSKIRNIVIFGLPDSHVNIDKANEYVMRVRRDMPFCSFIPFAVVDQNPEHWISLGAKGFKEHSYGQENLRFQTFKADKFYYAYSVAEEHELPLLLHAGRDRVPRIKEDILVQFPRLQIVLAHLGADFDPARNYYPDINQIISTLEALKDTSVSFDTSAIKNLFILREAIRIVGSERIVFGSDYPEEHPKIALNRILSLNLPIADLENILYNNAQRLLRC